MIGSLFRFVFVVAAVLLIGQIDVNGETIGARFHRFASHLWRSTQSELKETELLSQVVDFGAKRRASEAARDAAPTASDAETSKSKKEKPLEDISDEDRRSLMQLLK